MLLHHCVLSQFCVWVGFVSFHKRFYPLIVIRAHYDVIRDEIWLCCLFVYLMRLNHDLILAFLKYTGCRLSIGEDLFGHLETCFSQEKLGANLKSNK